MAKGSAAYGILGALGGILLALLAILIGAASTRMSGNGQEAPSAHKSEHH